MNILKKGRQVVRGEAMSAFEEEARSIWNKIRRDWRFIVDYDFLTRLNDHHIDDELIPMFAKHLQAAHAKGRKEAFEEAAQVCFQTISERNDDEHDPCYCHEADAAKIRERIKP